MLNIFFHACLHDDQLLLHIYQLAQLFQVLRILLEQLNPLQDIQDVFIQISIPNGLFKLVQVDFFPVSFRVYHILLVFGLRDVSSKPHFSIVVCVSDVSLLFVENHL